MSYEHTREAHGELTHERRCKWPRRPQHALGRHVASTKASQRVKSPRKTPGWPRLHSWSFLCSGWKLHRRNKWRNSPFFDRTKSKVLSGDLECGKCAALRVIWKVQSKKGEHFPDFTFF